VRRVQTLHLTSFMYVVYLVMEEEMKETRLYGLFEKRDGQWVRLAPSLAFTKSKAVKVFQNALLAYALGGVEHPRELRLVKKGA